MSSRQVFRSVQFVSKPIAAEGMKKKKRMKPAAALHRIFHSLFIKKKKKRNASGLILSVTAKAKRRPVRALYRAR